MRIAHLPALAALLTAPAFAGNVEPVPVEPVVFVDPAPLVDWSGGYAGVALGGTFSDTDVNGVDQGSDDDFGGGVFLGSNFQSGNWVYGGELGLGIAEDTDGAVDLRGRVGYAAGRALPYLSVGYTWIDTGPVEVDGPSVGLGVDYLVTDRVFLGGEVRYGDLDGSSGGNDFDVDGTSVGLRLGFRF